MNNIRVRPIPCIEATSEVGIVFINHPILGKFPCLVYRDRDLLDNQVYLVNSGLGDDVIIVTEEQFNDKLAISDEIQGYQIFLNTGDKDVFKDKELSCNSCNRLDFQTGEEICLYDNKKITDCNNCCNKYIDCFTWNEPKGE